MWATRVAVADFGYSRGGVIGGCADRPVYFPQLPDKAEVLPFPFPFPFPFPTPNPSFAIGSPTFCCVCSCTFPSRPSTWHPRGSRTSSKRRLGLYRSMSTARTMQCNKPATPLLASTWCAIGRQRCLGPSNRNWTPQVTCFSPALVRGLSTPQVPPLHGERERKGRRGLDCSRNRAASASRGLALILVPQTC